MDLHELNKELSRYTLSDTRRSLIQLFTTLCIYLACVLVMIVLLLSPVNIWLIVACSLLSSPILVKLFIIFHDCCHLSYFKSSRACKFIGHFLGLLVLTPYSDWQRTHGIHHRCMGNLERRGVGDVWLMTLDEYRSAGTWTKLQYRLYRHPLVLLFISAPFLFLVLNRFPSRGGRLRELYSVLFNDLMIALLFIAVSYAIGWQGFLLIFLPMLVGASIIGVWLFYVQHQFRHVYWAHEEDWDRYRAAMEGASYYTMPAFLRYLSGNIGYHHVHHLAPRIPNYRLKECFEEIPALQKIDPIPFFAGLRNIYLSLWDEQSGLLLSFREARATAFTP